MAKNKWLSKTQIEMIKKCPRQWAWRYKEGIKLPPSGAMKQGGVFHQVAEENYRQKVDSRKDLPLDEVGDRYSLTWKRELEREETVFDEGEKPTDVRDQGIAIATQHHKMVAPAVQPVQVEQEITRDLGDLLVGNKLNHEHPREEFPFDLKGIVDVIDESHIIRDNKAMAPSRVPTDPQALAETLAKDVQLSMYSLLYRLEHNEPEGGLALDVIVKNKALTPRTLTTARNRDSLRIFLNDLGHVARQIQSDSFPMHTDGWWCSKKWCGYYAKCAGRMLVTVDLAANQNLEAKLEDSIAK